MSTSFEVVVEPYNIRVPAREGERLYDLLKRAGVPFRTECGGRGFCGKCRVVVKAGELSGLTEAEKRLLGPEGLSAGYRLACQARVYGPTRLLLPPESRVGVLSVAQSGVAKRQVLLSPIVEKRRVTVARPSLENPLPDLDSLALSIGADPSSLGVELGALRKLPRALRSGGWSVTVALWRRRRVIGVEEGDTAGEAYGVAVDVGTTKLVVHLVDLVTGRTVGETYSENPQVIYGDDIISRVHAAISNPGTLEDMRSLVTMALDNMTKALAAEAGVDVSRVYAGVVVGNTVMHHIFLGVDVSGLGFSPFVPAFRGPLEAPGRELGLENVGYVYLPPVVAGYVGSDALADVIAVGLHLESRPSLLVDIGTNTEILLNTGEELLACSAPSGPAFEGGHIEHGMKAMTGAVSSVKVRGDDVEYSVIGGAKPIGLTGSALIDAVAGLLESGVLSERGFFDRSREGGRLRKSRRGEWYEYVIVPPEESGTGEAITVSEKDIGELRLAKAAIHSGIAVLLEESGLTANSLEKVYIAGSFGYSISVENAVRVGLLPAVDPSLVEQVGNTAVEGAKLMLVSEDAVREAEELSRRIRYVELTVHPLFRKVFTSSLKFTRPQA